MSERHEWLDEALRVAAAEDARTIVPAEVEARVMQAWDDRHTRFVGADLRRGFVGADLQVGPAWIAATAGVAAACVMALVALLGGGLRPPTQPAAQQPPAMRSDGTPSAAPATTVASEPGTFVTTPPPRPAARAQVSESAGGPPAYDTPPPVDLGNRDFVLIPEPPVDTTALQVVRVRMSRTAFASLGVPIENPDTDGLMEVEMIVGDDGVARSIRRAAFVSVVDERGER